MKSILALSAVLFALPLFGNVALAAPANYVRVCGDGSAGTFYVPGTSNCVDATAGVKAEEGVAMSLALPGTNVDQGKTFGASVHVGTFAGQNALGVGGAFRANDSITVDGGVGVGLQQGTVGGRAGMNVSW